jgi:V-type H+-transporting ATPase subunit F
VAVITLRLRLQDTVAGFLLAGIGHKDRAGTNFLVVDSSTSLSARRVLLFVHSGLGFPVCSETKMADIEAKFSALTEREDVGIILINQHVSV